MVGVGSFCGIATDDQYGSEEDRGHLMEVVGKAMKNFVRLVDENEHPDAADPTVVVEFHTQPLEQQCKFLGVLENEFANSVSGNSDLDKDGADALFETMFGHVAEEDIVGEGNSCDEFKPAETDGSEDPNGTGTPPANAFVKKTDSSAPGDVQGLGVFANPLGLAGFGQAIAQFREKGYINRFVKKTDSMTEDSTEPNWTDEEFEQLLEYLAWLETLDVGGPTVNKKGSVGGEPADKGYTRFVKKAESEAEFGNVAAFI